MKKLVQRYTDSWNEANKIGDADAMKRAEQSADAVRVSYYALQQSSLPGDVKYTTTGIEDVTDKLNHEIGKWITEACG